jgi:hypothetical protein
MSRAHANSSAPLCVSFRRCPLVLPEPFARDREARLPIRSGHRCGETEMLGEGSITRTPFRPRPCVARRPSQIASLRLRMPIVRHPSTLQTRCFPANCYRAVSARSVSSICDDRHEVGSGKPHLAPFLGGLSSDQLVHGSLRFLLESSANDQCCCLESRQTVRCASYLISCATSAPAKPATRLAAADMATKSMVQGWSPPPVR